MQSQAAGARHSSRPSLAAASLSLVLGVLLVAAALVDTAEASSFVVSIASGRSIDRVAARYVSRGYAIKRRDEKHRFLVVATQGDAVTQPPPVLSSPEPGQATAAFPGTAGSRAAAQLQQDEVPSLSPGGEEPELVAGDVTAAASTQPAGLKAVLPAFTRKTWGRKPRDSSSSVSIAATSSDAQTLQAIGGTDVSSVQGNPLAWLLTTRPLPAAQRRQLLRQLRATAPQQTASCPLSNASPDRDVQLGNVTEVMPYGISMVEADTAEMIEISKQFRKKVLYCVIDSGFDSSNAEFRADSSSGCIANKTRPNGTPYSCQTSYNVTATSMVGRHGTHTSGTVAAARNGRGVVGVSAEGALLYHFNAFGLSGTFDYIDVIAAWDDCTNELDYQKNVTNTPDMKMVVSMSFSSNEDVDVVSNYLKRAAVNRPDIMWLAAAGNDNDTQPNYPAMSPEVVSVAAVDWIGNKAFFSNFGPTVEWAAPGVNTLSLLPMASTSAYYTDTAVTLSPVAAPAASPDILINPRFTLIAAAKTGSISSQMVDCGLGGSACANATGKICLIQRGGGLLFCTKVSNCVAGGGVAALIYGRDDQPECEQITSVTLVSDQCVEPAGGWPIVMLATRKQGLYIKNVTASQPSTTVTLNTGAEDYSLGIMSGTSMATPAAAGVAGLVWSAHTECTASQLRDAISKSAQDRGPRGRDDLYGFGIVKALQAHKYLQANPCAPATNNSDCVGNWTAWTPCQDGSQTSTFVVTSPAVGSGKACEAPDSFLRNRTCSVAVEAMPDAVTVESGIWTSVDAIIANDLGVITKVDFLQLRTARKGLLRMRPLPEKGTQKSVLPANVVLQYLSPLGFVGYDTFGYTVSDASGNNSTATVTVTVAPNTCKKSSCLGGGSCTGTGCLCVPGTGMFKTWVTNKDRVERVTMPRVPACRFVNFTPSPPLKFNGNQAASNSSVVLDYSVLNFGVKSRCFPKTASPVGNVTFEAQAQEMCTETAVDLPPAPVNATAGCINGTYRYVATLPATPGCYIMYVWMIDNQARGINVQIKAAS
ncbi:hypothetical protein OEZ85_012474 [Tetradesmus obliquus]|uniref:Peptidase S8/S53 domain-containing protein n=1 Tax=Tetradesmus obliquus TaxID=3088 RepID=A0ABY8TVU4_TETOB|nr:hypothetical protein OEZ85_012474 [Tetradesmus obliquus]